MVDKSQITSELIQDPVGGLHRSLEAAIEAAINNLQPQIQEAINDVAERAMSSTRDLSQRMMRSVRENPWQFVMGAAAMVGAIGLISGLQKPIARSLPALPTA